MTISSTAPYEKFLKDFFHKDIFVAIVNYWGDNVYNIHFYLFNELFQIQFRTYSFEIINNTGMCRLAQLHYLVDSDNRGCTVYRQDRMKVDEVMCHMKIFLKEKEILFKVKEYIPENSLIFHD